MSQFTSLKSRLWVVAFCVLFVLLNIWQMPGTIAIRYTLLAFLLPVSLGLRFLSNIENPRPLNFPMPLVWLTLLTLWIVLGIALWGVEPTLSWKEFRGQWLTALGAGLTGAILTRVALAESGQLAMTLIKVVFWALLVQVLLHDALDFAYWISESTVPFRQAPVFYLPDIARALWEGRPMAEGFTERSGDKFSYINNMLAALVVAELVQRILMKRCWLPIGWPILLLSLAAILACTYFLQFRNGNVGLLLLFGFATFMVLVRKTRDWPFWKLVSIVSLVVASFTFFGGSLYSSDARWQTLIETVPIAWDTKTHQAWRRVSPYPELPNGKPVDGSNYERLAWAKEGLLLVLEHPLGTGYNRNAFGDGIDRKYDMNGEYRGGHSHSGLIDFTIANGIPGLMLWLLFLGALFATSWRAFMSGPIAPALTLMFIITGFLSRSIVDSNLRDHMLQQFMLMVSIFYVFISKNHSLRMAPVLSSFNRFLVINNANIGDLLVSTPTISALRSAYPTARIDAFVNSYNAPVIANNPDIDHVYFYTKAKHRGQGETVLGVHWRRLCLLWKLRLIGYEYIILAGNGFAIRPYRLARLVGSNHLVGFHPDGTVPAGMDIPVKLANPERHEVVKMLDLLVPLGIENNKLPALVLKPSDEAAYQAHQQLNQLNHGVGIVIAVHISARLPSQRWPADRFVKLMQQLHEKCQCAFMLFWAPGDENDPHHPGDDNKAAAIMHECSSLPVLAYPTHKLEELIGGLSVCNAMFCSDGGAMHIGAALGLPIVCLFGDSHANNWHPWAVPHRVLQPKSRDVKDVSVDEAVAACREIFLG